MTLLSSLKTECWFHLAQNIEIKMTGYSMMLSLGLTNHASDDYGVLATAVSTRRIYYNHYCTSKKCANPRNPSKKVLVLQSTKVYNSCPYCGQAVFTKRQETPLNGNDE